MTSPFTQSAPSSQRILEIDEIRDGILLLRGKGIRSVLMCSSINFALKSSDEQDAIILQYQDFMNTLDFSVQFFISSRPLNIEPYLDTLRSRAAIETNELLKIQTNEYIEFMKSLVGSEHIVTKTFYVIVPYQPIEATVNMGSLQKLLGPFGSKEVRSAVAKGKFEEWRSQLFQRVDIVRQGLARMGIRAIPLSTEELIELFYNLYNPDEAESKAIHEYIKQA